LVMGITRLSFRAWYAGSAGDLLGLMGRLAGPAGVIARGRRVSLAWVYDSAA
jgi:hypothetical protein